MRDALRIEVERAFRICSDYGYPITRLDGATNSEIAEIESATGIRLGDDLRALYEFSNGGSGDTWFAAITDQVTAFRFMPLKEVAEVHGWVLQSSFDPVWNNGGEPWDPRIRTFDHHTKWLPFAEFGGENAKVYFDADPSETGRRGQIIAYQHDPDAIRFCAEDLVSFLSRSNDLLEQSPHLF